MEGEVPAFKSPRIFRIFLANTCILISRNIDKILRVVGFRVWKDRSEKSLSS